MSDTPAEEAWCRNSLVTSLATAARSTSFLSARGTASRVLEITLTSEVPAVTPTPSIVTVAVEFAANLRSFDYHMLPGHWQKQPIRSRPKPGYTSTADSGKAGLQFVFSFPPGAT